MYCVTNRQYIVSDAHIDIRFNLPHTTKEIVMGQARTNRRRRKQAAQNYNHLDKRKRPNYKMSSLSVGESIDRSRRQAAAEAKRNTKKKSK